MHLYFLFLFNTWLGGVVCSFVALSIAGLPIVNWINAKKKQAIAKAKELEQRLHHHTNPSQGPSNPSNRP